MSPPQPSQPAHANLSAAILLACAILLTMAALSRSWLHADLSDIDRETIGRDVGGVDLGLVGIELCRPNNECVGDFWNEGQFTGNATLRAATRATFVAALLAAALCCAASLLLLAGRAAKVPRAAVGFALVVAFLGATYYRGAGTSKDNPIVAEYGWEFHTGWPFWLTIVATVAGGAALLALPRRPTSVAALLAQSDAADTQRPGPRR